MRKTKTSKKTKIVQFRIGKKAVELLQTIQRDKFNNPESKFFLVQMIFVTAISFRQKIMERK